MNGEGDDSYSRWFVRHRLHFAFCLELRNRCFTQYFEISMTKEDQPQVTPERLMQFGFAYAPPLIIGGAVSNKVFDTLASGPR